MIGNLTSGPGVMVLTMKDLFSRIDERKADKKIKVTMSYLEVILIRKFHIFLNIFYHFFSYFNTFVQIYNETIRDLFIDNSPALMLCEDPDKGACVQGLSERKPTSADEVNEFSEKFL